MEPRNRFQGMNSASLCSLAGRYDNPIPPRFLAPIDSSKIPALYIWQHDSWEHDCWQPSMTAESMKAGRIAAYDREHGSCEYHPWEYDSWKHGSLARQLTASVTAESMAAENLTAESLETKTVSIGPSDWHFQSILSALILWPVATGYCQPYRQHFSWKFLYNTW
jgi:hypothetical protein